MASTERIDLLDHESGFDLIRIFLGVALFIRGIVFIADGEQILSLITTEDAYLSGIVLQLVAGSHLVGGLMLAGGLFTRFAAAIQLPVLLGAVYYAWTGSGLLASGQSLELSVLVLFLLAVFSFYGAGHVSLDHLLLDAPEPERDRRATLAARIGRRRRSVRVAVEAKAPVPEAPVSDAEPSLSLSRYIWVFPAVAIVSAFLMWVLPIPISGAEIGVVTSLIVAVLVFFFAFFAWALNARRKR